MMYDKTFVEDTRIYVKREDKDQKNNEDEDQIQKREKENALKETIRLIM